MDNIEKLLKEIKDDKAIWTDKRGIEIKFSSKFLETVGDVFEKRGFGEAKIYLINLAGRNRLDALKLLQVLRKFQDMTEITTNRALGRTIITSLNTLKEMEV